MTELVARMSDTALDPAEVIAAVVGPQFGASVLFTGMVRNHDGGQAVSLLEYSAHPKAADMMAAICAEVHAESGLPVAALHRIGSLHVGDLAIVVAVAAAHRGEAFEVCERLVERIKHEVPIWKRQQFSDGLSEWVGLC